MSWTAIVAFKTVGELKTRLAPRLSLQSRRGLADEMLRKLVAALLGCDRVSDMIMVSACPHGDWPGRWLEDPGAGLNSALEKVLARVSGDALIIHADLPLVESGDIDALIDMGTVRGIALAPDRHRAGTNAVAIRSDRKFTCLFGSDSLSRHLGELVGRPVGLVERTGLSTDCDTPDDLDLLSERYSSAQSFLS